MPSVKYLHVVYIQFEDPKPDCNLELKSKNSEVSKLTKSIISKKSPKNDKIPPKKNVQKKKKKTLRI